MAMVKTKSRKENKNKITWKEIKRQKVLLFWAAVMVIYGIIFYYLPLGGWAMAFQNYKPRTGILHSEFVGLEKFRMLFSDMTFIRVIRNTLAMGVINLVVTFFTAIAFAVLLNEIKSKGGKKVVQTISYLPHFLSWIIVTGILHDMLSGTGIINELLVNLHLISKPINFFAHTKYFWPIVAFANVWKEPDGMQLFIWRLLHLLTRLYMKPLPLMVQEDGKKLNTSHCRELNLQLLFCFL